MIKLSSYSMFVVEVPRYLLFYIPLFYIVDKIFVLDNSLLELKDCRPEIDRLLKFLKVLKLDKKVTVFDPIEYDKERWKANERSVEEVHKLIQPLRDKCDESFYLAGYLGHRLQTQYSKYYYAENIIAKLGYATREIIFVGRKLINNRSYKVLNNIASKISYIIFGIFMITGMPLLLLLSMLKKVQFVRYQPAFWKGGLCVDMLSGPSLTTESEIDPDVYGDTCFVEKDGLFSIKNSSFFAYGWKNKNNKAWKKILENKEAKVFGDQVERVKLRVFDYLKLCLENYQLLFKCFVKHNNAISKKIFNYEWYLVKYFVYRFRAQVNFYYNRPSVYFSRLDYSYLQHVLGSVCYRYGIHYSGVCHSPAGGAGQTPGISILSYDTYFIYMPIFCKDYFKTWENAHTKLVPVGVWRSDFSVVLKNNVGYIKKRDEIRNKYEGKFIVGLHLPVPNTCLYRKQEVDYWMRGFEQILNELDDVEFILFPRRLESSPKYFHEWIEKIKKIGKSEIAQDLNYEWTNSYPWTYICDMVVGCSYSDVVLEALACGVPAVSYADVGKNLNQLEQYDSQLSVYTVKSLKEMIELIKNAKWPTSKHWNKYAKEFVGIADGKSRERMKDELKLHISPGQMLYV